MEEQKLRMGNFLDSEYDGITQVSIRLLERIYDKIESASPIPLTKEWHLKFGGKDESSPPHNIRFSYDIKGTTLLVNYDVIKELWWFQYRNPFLIKDVLTPLPREIKYVHEFQNFYMEFTGNELKI